MEPAIYNEWRLVSLSPLPAWALVLVAIAIAGGAVCALAAVRREPRRWLRGSLLGLRLLAAVALLALVFEPGRRLMQTMRVKNRVAVLVDRSASMKFPDAEGNGSRMQWARQFLDRSSDALAELESRFTVELLAFDKDVSSLDLRRLDSQLVPVGNATDIAGAIRRAAAGSGAGAGRRLSGIVLLSDGADNVELSQGLLPPERQALSEGGVPISTILVGGEGFKDLAVEKIAVDDFAFVRNTLEVNATLRINGFAATEIPVALKREGRVIATRTAKVSGPGTFQATFSFAPDSTGQFVYTVEAPVLAGEAITENNSQSFPLKVIRDRVRVLLVVGRPSWDVRFLRGLLKEDPNVDLISFFILRTVADNPRVVSDDELSLIPFPVREIFQEQLSTFDLVILQDFSYEDRSYQMEQYLKGIAAYVHEGGALVMVGGENSFGEGRYERSDLQVALPVEPSGLPPSLEPFKARITADGRRHPVTMVATTGEASDRAWAAMPELAGVHVTRAKAGTRVLLDHPFLTVDGANVPVVVLGEHGRGRVMALLADSTWQWSFGASAAGSSERVFDRLWSNAIRWLVRDPALTPVDVSVEKTVVEPAEAIQATVSARAADYGPASGAEVQLELVDVADGHIAGRQGTVCGADGIARISIVAPADGPYKVLARASKDGVMLGEDADAVVVRPADAETADGAPRPELLRQLAATTGGRFYDSVDALPQVPLVDPETVEVGRRRDLPIWDRWYSLALLALALAFDWGMRRRWGYP